MVANHRSAPQPANTKGSESNTKTSRLSIELFAATTLTAPDCWDNACSETLFGSLKVKRLHGQRFVTRRQAKDETIAWLLWYNKARLHSTLAYVSPMQFESEWLARQANS